MKFKTRVFFVLIVGVVLFGAANTGAQAQQRPRRIVFARGATVARATGFLRGVRDQAWFVMRVSANQHMRVEIKGRGPTRGVLFFPSGKQDGGPGGIIFDGIVEERGDFRIRVTESSMAEAWRGRFTVTVEILPRREAGPAFNGLENFVGKYPSELFRSATMLRPRLRTLLRANYKSFLDRLQVEMPIERDGDFLIARGCMAHQCTIEEAVLAIDLTNEKLYAAIKFNRRYRTFPADRSSIPEALIRAMN